MNNLKEINITKSTCHCFDHIFKIKDIYFDNMENHMKI